MPDRQPITIAGFKIDHANYECSGGNWYVNVYGFRTDDPETYRCETVIDGLDERTAALMSRRFNTLCGMAGRAVAASTQQKGQDDGD